MIPEIPSPAPSWQKIVFPPLGRRRAAKRRIEVELSSTSPDPDFSALLVEVGQTRDIERFELLFRHFAPRVRAYMAKSGSPGGAEELMQETMVAVWNKAALYDPDKGAPSTWIFTIARNLRIDAWRREKHPEFDVNDPAFQPATEPRADSQIEAAEAAALVRAALDALPREQAEVMRLAFFADSSQSAIAETLRVPLGTVKSRMRMALGKLRAAFGEEEL